MQHFIEKLVTDFERGSSQPELTLLRPFGFQGCQRQSCHSAGPGPAAIHEVLSRSFGMPMRKSSPTLNFLTLNANCFFGIETSKEKDSAVDHFALGIQNFKAEEAAEKLKKTRP